MAAAEQITCTLERYADLLDRAGILVRRPGAPVERAVEVRFATDDSRAARPGTLFACKGAAFKREYLLGAIEAGAVAYVSAEDHGVDVPLLQVSDIRSALGLLADAAYDHPSGRVKVCAFTGTKGKTTSAYYLRSILAAHAEDAGAPAPALLTGVEYDDGVECGGSKLTTPESFELQRRLANAAGAGCGHVVMEASSQAMKYRRTLGVEFEVGAFTNFGEDHISPIEHPTLEDYLESKLLLFERCRSAVVNLDSDVAGRALAAARASGTVERVLTYSMARPEADVAVLDHGRAEAGIRATVRTPSWTRELVVPSPALFNLGNALGAIACAEALGVGPDAVERGLATVSVPGRMELYPSGSGRVVGVVDFAHNGMSLETLLADLRASYPDRELTVVFGATGGKGVDRRETMGVAAGRLADRIVITEDDPGPEDPAAICEAIARAASAQGNDNWIVVPDRGEAIIHAVRESVKPSVVVVTGKGCESTMIRRNGPEPYETDGARLRRALADWEREHPVA